MIRPWIWIGWLLILALGCGEVSVRPFVEPTDAGIGGGEDGGENDDDGGLDDDDGGVDDDDGGPDDDDDGGPDDESP